MQKDATSKKNELFLVYFIWEQALWSHSVLEYVCEKDGGMCSQEHQHYKSHHVTTLLAKNV